MKMKVKDEEEDFFSSNSKNNGRSSSSVGYDSENFIHQQQHQHSNKNSTWDCKQFIANVSFTSIYFDSHNKRNGSRKVSLQLKA